MIEICLKFPVCFVNYGHYAEIKETSRVCKNQVNVFRKCKALLVNGSCRWIWNNGKYTAPPTAQVALVCRLFYWRYIFVTDPSAVSSSLRVVGFRASTSVMLYMTGERDGRLKPTVKQRSTDGTVITMK